MDQVRLKETLQRFSDIEIGTQSSPGTVNSLVESHNVIDHRGLFRVCQMDSIFRW